MMRIDWAKTRQQNRWLWQGYTFKYLVVDEGHRLKNFDCMLIRELKLLKTNNKLLLSGTPLQNNLAELWSLLHFILPDVFSNLEQFQSWFDFSSNVNPDQSQVEQEAEKRQRVVQKLHSILRPFLLRRIKSDVETSLPRKKEIILYASMTPKQHEVRVWLLVPWVSAGVGLNKWGSPTTGGSARGQFGHQFGQGRA